METSRETTLDRTDVQTLLGALADRLRLHGLAALGMAGQEGGRGTIEHRVKVQLAADLEEVAAIVDLLRGGLCGECRLADAAKRLEVHRVAPR